MHWYPKINIKPEDPSFKTFVMTPIGPKDVINFLNHANHKSSPGQDRVSYGILFHLTSTHHIMATLLNKVLATNAVPALWGASI